jgi:hypothetical protein
MKSAFRVLGLFLAVFLSISIPVFGQNQSAVTGGLSGAVTDPSGALVGGATVTLVGPQGTQKLTTGNNGSFTATGLTPGIYTAIIEKPGFQKITANDIQVVVNSNSMVNFNLHVGDVSTTVEVTSTSAAIDTTQTAITTNLTDTFYNSIPMPRNVSAIFYAAPGVAQGEVNGGANEVGPGSSNPSIGGASALENLYVVDGVTITDQAFGSIGTFNRYHGSLGTGINLAFIQEVDVKTTAFEPQYGKATGGIVQIITKSGGDSFHGALGAYLQPGKFYASRHQFYQYGYRLTTPYQTLNNPEYDASAELGGYIPHFRDRIFFFGAFDPTLNQTINLANPANPVTYAHGPYAYSTTTLSWAGKLTFKLSGSTTFEASTFGDPSRHNSAPSNTLSTNNPASLGSSYNFGSRDSVARLRSAFTSTLAGDISYAYNYNHFNETPAQDIYRIDDQSGNSLPAPTGTVTTGLGPYEPSKNGTYSLAGNLSKTVNFIGQHTLSVGYSYDHTNFFDIFNLRSGPSFPIPGANAAGTSLTSLFSNIPAGEIGSMTDAWFRLFAINTNSALTTTDRTCTRCPINATGQSVYASIYRGTLSSDLDIHAIGRYHTAYGNDDWQLNRFVNLNLGLRWEQEQIGGKLLNYTFHDSWSPRLGINIDPLGDHKGKLFFNYGRNFWAMPLDAAIRQLGNEKDDTAFYFAPIKNSDGTFTVVPDAAHVLNGLAKSTSATGTVSNFGAPNFSSSTGEGIIPGTKSEYEDEYVIGVEREIKNGLVLKARYTDRRLGRVIEDIGSQSPEGSEIVPGYTGGIANPGPSTDIAVNENELAYTQAQWIAANGSGNVTKSSYHAPVAGCTTTNDTYFAIGGPFINGLNQPVGGGCFLNLSTADLGPGDRIPDGFVKPVRRYNALEFEIDKRFSNHWLAQINYRWGNLWGNYEGAYRNDNGQSDPGISSLFDFTPGKLNLLGDQFAPGFLSSDRRNVGNMFLSYTVGSDTPIFSRMKGLQIGAGFRGQSGVPLSRFGDHPIYLNQGEVPIGGRGAAGRTPSTLQLDTHLLYSVGVHEKYTMKFGMDMFNVTNSQYQLSRVQFTQTTASGPGVAPPLDSDFGRPTAFQGPFYARALVRLEF